MLLLELKTIAKAGAYIRRECYSILLFLAVFVFIFLLQHKDILEFQHKENSVIVPRFSTDSHMHHDLCTFRPLSPKDALEERFILDSIAWPETPLLPGPVSLEKTSHPAHSSFTILPRRGGGQWHVGDQLEVMIQMSDFQGHAKTSGGDFLLSRLHNRKIGAGVAGQVVDHLNGSYSAVFSLLWDGEAKVEVMLVHPSEAIPVLNRLNIEQPDRVFYKSLFRSGSLSESTVCNVCLRPTGQPLCDYTDVRTGEPWFCYKPKKLSCDDRINHLRGKLQNSLKAQDKKLFQRVVNLKVNLPAAGPASVNVLPKKEDEPKVKSSIMTPGPSGYYHRGVWRALDGTTVRQFNTSSAISQCLTGKVVHVYGDSTIRQWYYFLNAAMQGLKKFNLHSLKDVGPFMSLDYAHNILVTYRCHGPPLTYAKVPMGEFRYIANELDDLRGGPDTVVVIGIWAHFSTFPMEVYIRRLQSIRWAVVRLLHRAPGTLVVIRTPNPKALKILYVAVTNSDWFSLQCDKVLRAMFKGLNVHLIDAWEMVLAHHLSHDLHPPLPIIKNMINVLLSYTCPQKGG